MAIVQLTEDHKRLAEEVLKGTPKSKIAEIVGVHRATLYEWMKDPLWQRYLQDLSDAKDDARISRLQEVTMTSMELTEKYMRHMISILDQGDPALIAANLPTIDSLTSALKRVAELQTAIAGPSRGREGDRAPDSSERGRDIKGLLDRILTKEEPLH